MKKKFSFILILISLFSTAQIFSSGMIEQGNGSSNIFSVTTIGSDGKFYCFFNDGDFKSSTNNVNPVYRLVRWEPLTSTWVTVGNIDASNIPGAIVSSNFATFNNGIGLEIDSTGAYHLLINVNTSNGSEIMYVYSNNGTTWVYTSIDNSNNQTNYSYANLQLKLDTSNRPHIYYTIRNVGTGGISSRVYSIIHKYHNGSSWISETPYSQTGGSGIGSNEINMMSASLDGNNKSHIAIVAETNGSGTDGSLLYTTNASGSWIAPVFLATGATGNAAADKVCLLSDTNNKQHIVYRENATSLKVMYRTNKTGSWTGGQINSNLTSGIMSSVDCYNAFTRNSNNDLFLVYNASTTATNNGQVNYACLFNGSSTWQTGSIFTGNSRTGQYISAEFSNTNKAMITFDHFTDPASTGGSPSYGPPNNPRQLQYATTSVTNLSVNEIIHKDELKAYPNPTHSIVNIDLDNSSNDVTIQILDLSGKVLVSQKASRSSKLDLSTFSSGIYVVKVTSAEGSKSIKVVKN